MWWSVGSLPEVVYANVKRSLYYRTVQNFRTFDEVVDEIYSQVDHVEPWVRSRGLGDPSSAFCLLYRLFSLRISVRQVELLIEHPDSPYIRALGFLFLRFVCDPRELWDWLGPYVQDEENFKPRASPSAGPITLGRYVSDLLLDMKYYDLMLPRIPVPVHKDIQRQLPSVTTGVSKRHKRDHRGENPDESRCFSRDQRHEDEEDGSRHRKRGRGEPREDGPSCAKTSNDWVLESKPNTGHARASESNPAHETNSHHPRFGSAAALRDKPGTSQLTELYGPQDSNLGGSRSGTAGIVDHEGILYERPSQAVLRYQRENADE